MSNDTREFATESTPGREPFAGKVDEVTEYYRKMLYGDEHYYGPAIDAVLHEAVRQSLAEDGFITLEDLCRQLDGPCPSEFDATVAEGLRELIWETAPLSGEVSEGEQ